MPVQNRIVKVQKRSRALVRFDESRIWKAILRAAESIGGFRQDFVPGVNDRIFDACGDEASIAGLLALTLSASQELAASATLLIRFFTLWFGVLLGLGVLFTSRRLLGLETQAPAEAVRSG